MDLFIGNEYLERALDAATLRQQVTSNNMSHVNDPTYHGQQVEFEDSMSEAIDKWNNGDTDAAKEEGRLEAAHTEATVVESPSAKVDMNQEMANTAKNQILYNAFTMQASGYFKSLKYVIDNTGH